MIIWLTPIVYRSKGKIYKQQKLRDLHWIYNDKECFALILYLFLFYYYCKQSLVFSYHHILLQFMSCYSTDNLCTKQGKTLLGVNHWNLSYTWTESKNYNPALAPGQQEQVPVHNLCMLQKSTPWYAAVELGTKTMEATNFWNSNGIFFCCFSR